MQFDGRTGTVIFNGPSTDMEAAAWDKAMEHRADIADELAEYNRSFKRA